MEQRKPKSLNRHRKHLQFVKVVIQGWDALFQSLAFPDICNDCGWFGGSLEGISRQDLPMVKHALWEGLALGVGTKITGES